MQRCPASRQVGSTVIRMASAIVVAALVFMWSNGVHDAQNSVAPLIATRLMPPFGAVIWAAIFRFLAASTFVYGLAAVVGLGLTSHGMPSSYAVLSGLMAAIAWNLLTWA